MKLSLRRRMILSSVLPVSLVATVMTVGFVAWEIHELEQNLKARGNAISNQLATSVEFSLFAGNRENIASLAASALRTDPDATGVAVLDAVGTVVAETGIVHPASWPAADGSVSVRELPDKLLFSRPVLRSAVAVDDVYAGIEASSRPDNGAPPALGHVIVELSPLNAEADRNRFILAGVAVAVLGALLGALLARLTAKGVLEPLLNAVEVVENIGQGDADARMSVTGAGPLKNLAQGINEMAARVAVTQEELRLQVDAATVELLAQKHTAERATAAKSQFLASASHDLRQPLHALGLFVSTLSHSEAARREPVLVQHIESSVTALQEMLDAILDISRLDSGNINQRSDSFAIGRVFERLSHDLESLASAKGLHLRVRPTPLRVSGDRQMIERILLNLLANAVRYTQEGGILLSCRQRGGKARVEVWDTGVGIDPAQQQEIFNEYVQLHNPERDRRKGLGLGLSICRRLADLMQAPIGVRSRRGRGSVFWVELPLAGSDNTRRTVNAENAVIEQIAAAGRLEGEVLVIEDDPLVLAAMVELMTDWGLVVTAAASAEEARQRISEGADADNWVPDLAVCDIRLPGQASGIELGQELQTHFPGLRVLLVSADVTEQSQRTARQAGFPLLKKPVPPGRLRAALRQMLVRRPADAAEEVEEA